MARPHPEELRYQAERVWLNQEFVTLLCADNPALSDTSSLGDWLGTELLPANGYSRSAFTFSSVGAFDAPNREQDLPPLTASFSATGAGLIYRTVITLRGGNIRGFLGTVPASSVSPESDRILLPSHGCSSGEAVVFHPLDGDALPDPLVAGTRYFVDPLDADRFAIYFDSDLTAPVDLTSTGSGSFRVRNADGTIVCIDIAPSNRTTAAGVTDTYQLSISQMGAL